ncbi:MAG: YopX family protein [Turicibacter sp.]|nr:YopX family protein [Turicibacter sp.]
MLKNRLLSRGKSPTMLQNNGWVVGAVVQLPTGAYYMADIDDPLNFKYEIDPNTLGQCTGRHDRDGDLIFEDDRVEMTTNNEKETYLVIWHDDGWAFQSEIDGDLVFGFFPQKSLKIIGNTHEK